MNVARFNSKPSNVRGRYIRRFKANLRGANLCEADLRGANLRGANLRGANLCEADLYGANLYGANLRGADLCEADLSRANLCGANLRGANLRGANLCEADLYGANLYGADLRDTTLDPTNKPNNLRNHLFAPMYGMPGWAEAYRRRTSPIAGGLLVDGRIFASDVFSTCEETECHPGFYFWPTEVKARYWCDYDVIKVAVRYKDIHSVGDKHRASAILIVGDLK